MEVYLKVRDAVLFSQKGIARKAKKENGALATGRRRLTYRKCEILRGEREERPEFAKKLAALPDLYVNDASGTAHRAHTAIEGVAKYLKSAVSDFLMQKADVLLLGGGMKFTFYEAHGNSIRSLLMEEDKPDPATLLLEKAKAKGVSLLLPTDVVVADTFAAEANSQVYDVLQI
ncbi:hypothetical protein Nepgr_006980 [Nepenthes gracilis]|uniref:phosphoglycerate kinase n=1 Tax=Nepenthes gracilis TaxID=150966 RepID=A0AAD3S649_NEPGR|nr:hypothetical protein Nepgr_006980 [Nepenthes gracilis]